jgi:hypothetical protein
MLWTSCQTSPPLPSRDYEVTLYLIDWENSCVISKKTGRLCDKYLPDNLIAISPEDYAKERNYQDELKKRY